MPSGYRLVALDIVDSTNREALRRAVAGDRGQLWLLAETQTAGRGRRGRKWISGAGNLTASLLVRLGCPLETALQLSLVAGVAAAESIERLAEHQGTPIRIRLKWPNDMMVGRRKLGGILLESAVDGRPEGFPIALGIGINIAAAPTSLGRNATSLIDHGINTTPKDVLSTLSAAMSDWLATWDEGRGFALIRKAWLARAGKPGGAIRVRSGDRVTEGAFVGIDETGALLLRERAGGERRILVGDVLLAPPADATADTEN